MISVVVPVLNGAATIAHQLEALGSQPAGVEFEVIVADNGSTDDTAVVVARFQGQLPGLRLVDASRTRGPGAARNEGVRNAEGDVLAFCDADDVVAPTWLAAMAEATREHHLVAGSLDFHALGSPLRANVRPPAWGPGAGAFGWLEYGLGANLAVSRSAFDQVGGFAEEMLTGEDIDLSWRLQLAGYGLHYAPSALVYKRPRADDRHKAIQHLAYGQNDVLLYKRLRALGMPRRSAVAQIKLYGWLALNCWSLLADQRRRATWLIAGSGALGRVIGSVQYRTLFL